MTVPEIAQQLIQLCQAGNFEEAYATLFAENAKSIEPDGTIADGITAILKKSENFGTDVQFLACEFGEPSYTSNYFSVVQKFHSLIRKTGEKKTMEEIGIYKVAAGKIVEERFFY